MSEYIVNLDGELGMALAVACAGAGLVGKEIVRCRDCAKWATEKRLTGGCCGPNGDADPDGFCAWSEKKEVEQ